MKKYGFYIICLLFMLSCQDEEVAETQLQCQTTFGVAKLETKIVDDPTDIYYPRKGGPYPFAMLFQGGRVDKQYYSLYAKKVAEQGFIVVVPNHHSSVLFRNPEGEVLFKSEGYFSESKQIEQIESYIQLANQTKRSTLYNKVEPQNMAFLGHSYGAAMAIKALQSICEFPFCPEGETYTRPASLKAVALSGINTRPLIGVSAVQPVNNDGLPLAFINGHNESRARYDVTKTSFSLIQDPPKAFVSIKGTNHYAMTNMNNPPAPPGGKVGPQKDPGIVKIDQEESVMLTAHYSALFLKAHMKSDACAWEAIYEPNEKEGVLIETASGTWRPEGL